ncbi:MAG TPA: MATE family efflux transporter [Candidatus Dormibacteraeota bacterium]|jgi:putative MATE family efflux protein|nr:MATE family efflux transporter [Candidatus Dormibacteraeota bacterium]
MVSRRSILSLALPALGALAAEPLYLLADTAIVGHLGRVPLAGLAVAATVITAVTSVTTFLEYGTTGGVARALGARRREAALDLAVQATWLALLTGLLMTAVAELLAPAAVALVGGGDVQVREQAIAWLRIAALGLPFVCVALAGQGWLRGLQDTVTPFVVVVVANAVSAGLSAALVYGAHLGLRGSAIANALAQSGAAVIFAIALARQGCPLRPSPRRMAAQLVAARDLGARTLAFLFSFTVATAVAAHIGPVTVAAHQIAIQLWGFLALSLDALAIAAQAMVGAAVGAGDGATARALAGRLMRWGLAGGAVLAVLLLAGAGLIPRLFTSDPAVLDTVGAAWWYLALMQPAAAVLFVLDGVLIGAGDTAYLAVVTTAAGLLVYLPLALIAGAAGLGLGGIWFGLTCFVLVRLGACLARMRGTRWLRRGMASAAVP